MPENQHTPATTSNPAASDSPSEQPPAAFESVPPVGDIVVETDDNVVSLPPTQHNPHDELNQNQLNYTELFNGYGYVHLFFGGKERVGRMVPTKTAATSNADKIPLQLELMERPAFKSRHSHMTAVPAGVNPENGKLTYSKPADIWLNNQHRHIADGLCFNPEEPPLKINPYGQYNLYQGRAVNEADCSREDSVKYLKPFLDHITLNLCGGDIATFWVFIKVMAAKYQNPTIKPFATIIHGIEGTGKDTIVEPFMRLYGAHGKKATKASQVIGEYNAGTLSNCMFLWMDEAFAGTKDATDCMKTVVFSDTLRLTDKFVPAWEERSLNQTILTTNREGMIRFATHDRRYFVLKMSDDRASDTPENKKYFTKLWQLINSESFLGHLANLLTHADIQDFNFRRPPVTKSMAIQKLSTADAEEKFIHQIIRDGGIRPLVIDGLPEGESPVIQWPEKIHAADITQMFRNWLRDTRTPFAKDESIALGAALKNYGFVKKQIKIDGKNKMGWVLPTVEEAKKHMMHLLGADITEEL